MALVAMEFFQDGASIKILAVYQQCPEQMFQLYVAAEEVPGINQHLWGPCWDKLKLVWEPVTNAEECRVEVALSATRHNTRYPFQFSQAQQDKPPLLERMKQRNGRSS